MTSTAFNIIFQREEVMPYLEIKGRKLYYAVKGHGPRITILRGLSRSSAFWLGFDKMLAKSFQVLTRLFFSLLFL